MRDSRLEIQSSVHAFRFYGRIPGGQKLACRPSRGARALQRTPSLHERQPLLGIPAQRARLRILCLIRTWSSLQQQSERFSSYLEVVRTCQFSFRGVHRTRRLPRQALGELSQSKRLISCGDSTPVAGPKSTFFVDGYLFTLKYAAGGR